MHLLQLNNFGSVPFFHFNLSLSEGLVFGLQVCVDALQVGHCLAQLLDLSGRLGLHVFGDFLILSLVNTLKCLDLVL